MQKNGIKLIIGFFFAGFAGLSFTTAILPLAMSNLFGMYSIDLMLAVRGYGIPLALAWAACGVAIAWQGGTSRGAAILGLCGLASGVILGAFALAGSPAVIGVSAATGLIYGGLGGAILGKALGTLLNDSAA
ncbi:MAG: hypothetical protein Kow0031_06010 [Anaerolineae bacterium]